MAYKLKTKIFDKWQRKADVTDAMLIKAIDEMANGLIDADLGGNVFKKRIGLPGRGKRGGLERCWPQTAMTGGFFSTDSPKTKEITLPSRNYTSYRELPTTSCLERTMI